MLVFLVGSSSTGKSKLLQWLRANVTPTPITLNADDFLGEQRQQMVAQAQQGHVSWSVLQDGQWFGIARKSWHRALVDAAANDRPVYVDTVFQHLQADLDVLAHRSIPYRLVMVAVNLKTLLRNIIARSHDPTTARRPAAVLEEVAELFKPSVHGKLVFRKSDMDAFRRYGDTLPPHGWMKRRLASTLRNFEKQFFPNDEIRVRVAPAVPFKIDRLIIHRNTPACGRLIMDASFN